jgi:hypothetical protein
MRILSTKQLRYNIGMTGTRGIIELVINKDDPKYQFFVDSVPLEEVENNAMLKIYNLI